MRTSSPKTSRSRVGSRKNPRRPNGYTRSFKRLRDGMEATRSSVDGVWRVWAQVDASRIDPAMLGRTWVPVGAGKKLADAHQQARHVVEGESADAD